MKKFFLINLVIAAFGASAISQGCPNQPIQSPISKKPTSLSVASLNCNELVVQWQGNPGQSYKLNLTTKDEVTGKLIAKAPQATIKNNGLNYTAAIPVKAGTKMNWSVQGITTMYGRTFYSYPLKSGKDVIIPGCQQVVATVESQGERVVVANEVKVPAKLYPNPVQSILNISLGSNSNGKKTISVFDGYGKMVINQPDAKNNMQINVKHLNSGSYFVRIIDENGKIIYNGRFIKL